MRKITDFLRDNAFWVLMAAGIALVAGTYLVFVRDMQADVASKRNQLTRQTDELRNMASEPVIPNSGMVAAAGREQQKLKMLYGQSMMLYAFRSRFLDQHFPSMDEEGFSPIVERKWWNEYDRRTQELLKQVKDRVDMAKDAFDFAIRPTDYKGNLALAKSVQRAFWVNRYVADLLIAVNASEPKLIEKLLSVRPGSAARGGLEHQWIRSIPINLRVEMRLENVGSLIAPLQNAPRPIMVRSYRAIRADPDEAGAAGGGESEPSKPAKAFEVTLDCDIIEFLPVPQSITFSGQLFAGPSAIGKWLDHENRALCEAAWVLADRIPSLNARVQFEMGASPDGIRDSAERELLAKIDARAPVDLKALLDGARGEDGQIKRADEERIRKQHEAEVSRLKGEARAEAETGVIQRLCAAGGFGLVYDYLYPFVPQEGYFAGGGEADRRLAIVRAPDGSGGQWWIAEFPGGSDERATEGTKVTLRSLVDSRKRAGLTELGRLKDKAVFLKNAKGEPAEVLVSVPDGTAVACPVVKHDGRPVALSDAAFRFATVIHAAVRAGAGKAAPGVTRIDIVAEEELQRGQRDEFEVNLPGPPSGTLKIMGGLRK